MKLNQLKNMTTKRDVQNWLLANTNKKYTKENQFRINDDLTVDVLSDVKFKTKVDFIPVKFRIVKGGFDCTETKITESSLKNFPQSAGGLYLQGLKLTNLHNIHKYVKELTTHDTEGNIYIGGTDLTSHMLGAMLIKGFAGYFPSVVDISKSFIVGSSKSFIVGSIINKFIKENKSIHECQEFLIENGFSEYAKL